MRLAGTRNEVRVRLCGGTIKVYDLEAADSGFKLKSVLPSLVLILTICTGVFNLAQEVKMDENKEKSGCLDQDKMYPHGSKICKDIYWDEYCFKCVDGKWEAHA
jgi:hypothetical protein